MVLEIGGGFAGISILAASQQWSSGVPTQVWVLSGLFGLLFFFGIVAGLALAESRRLGTALSAVYQGLQIPVVSSPALTYSFFSGIELRVGWWRNRPVCLTGLGARCTFFLTHSYPWGIGVNVLALGLFVYLLVQLAKSPKAGNGSGRPCTS